MRIFWIIICLLLVMYTSHKLYVMMQIRGFMPGTVVTTCTITQKWEEQRKGTYYCISWNNPPEAGLTRDQDRIDYAAWSALNVGDPITVVAIGKKRDTYARASIFAVNGNFGFDIVLLLIEIGVAIGMLVKIRRTGEW